MRTLITALALSFSLTTAFAETIHVPADHPTIGAAIQASKNGDVIQVAAGTYDISGESVNPGGKTIIIQGTLNADGSLATTLSGGMYVSDASAPFGSYAKFKYLMIEDGLGVSQNSVVDFIGCRITSTLGGGAVGIIDSGPRFFDCTISDSYVTGGHVTYRPGTVIASGMMFGAAIEFTRCTIENNESDSVHAVAGLSINNFAIVYMWDCQIKNNTGQGIYVNNGGTVTLYDGYVVCGNTVDGTATDFNQVQIGSDPAGASVNISGTGCLSGACDTDADGILDCYDIYPNDFDNDGLPDDFDPCPTWPGDCSEDGLTISVTNTNQSIQQAIDMVLPGGTVNIIAGTFPITTPIDPGGKAVTLVGATDDAGNATTFLDGGNSTRVLQCVSGEDANTTFENLVIQRGRAEGVYPDDTGAGMYCHLSSPTLINCTFTGNSAANGGGMFNSSSDPTLNNCEFTNNSAMSGGGMMNYVLSSPTLTNCTFTGNSAGDNGGGMYNRQLSNPSLGNTTFCENTAGGVATNENQIENDSESTYTETDVNCILVTCDSDGDGLLDCVDPCPYWYGTDCSTIEVTQDQDIQPAIDGVEENGTIEIAAGEFDITTPIMVTDRQITIRGTTNSDGTPATILDGGAVAQIILCTGDEQSSPVFENLVIENGANIMGGGIAIIDATPTFINCTIRNNTAGNQGGGIWSVGDASSPSPLFRDCKIHGNVAYVGGGLAILTRTVEFENCQVFDNTAADGPGIFIGENALASLTGTTVCGNTNSLDLPGEVLQITGNHEQDSASCVFEICRYASESEPPIGCDFCVYWDGDWTGDCTTDGIPIVYVDGNQPSIQDAIDSVPHGGIVQIAQGDYSLATGAINPGGKAVTIRGAIDGATGEPATVISGAGSTRIIECVSGETETTVFENLILSSGFAEYGAGMYNWLSNPKLVNCIFEDNHAEHSGGGIYNQLSQPTLVDCRIRNNFAGQASGGMHNNNGMATTGLQVENLVICGNDTVSEGSSITSNQIGGDPDPFAPYSTVCIAGSCDDCGPCTENCNDFDQDGIPNADDPCPQWPGSCEPGEHVIYVDADNPSINAAIQAVQWGGTVRIASGTFALTDTINPMGKAVTIRGALDSEGGRATMLMGNETFGIIECNSGEDESTEFRNLVIAHGSASRGGGMNNYQSSPKVVNCAFAFNTASLFGGAMYNYRSNPTITNCLFLANIAEFAGGGIYTNGGSPNLSGCEISANTGIYDAGGIYQGGTGTTTLSNCVICGNNVDGNATMEGQAVGSIDLDSDTCITESCNDRDGDTIPDDCDPYPDDVNNDGVPDDTVVGPEDPQALLDAIATASPGDTIYLQAGTYQLDETIELGESGVTIQGVPDTNGDKLPETIIDGSGTHRVLQVSNSSNRVTLRDLVISNGLADTGGGIIVQNGTVTIEHCVFMDNSSTMDGGALHADDCSGLIVSDCMFWSNAAGGKGGGIHLSNCIAAELLNNSIGYCSADDGGGLAIESSSFFMVGGSVANNNAVSGAAGMMIRGMDASQSAQLVTSVFGNNNGTAVTISETNVTSFFFADVTRNQGGISIAGDSSADLFYATVCGNQDFQIAGTYIDLESSCVSTVCDENGDNVLDCESSDGFFRDDDGDSTSGELVNGDFSNGLEGWRSFNEAEAIAVGDEDQSGLPEGFDSAVKVAGAYWGTESYSGVGQDICWQPGETITFGADYVIKQSDQLLGMTEESPFDLSSNEAYVALNIWRWDETGNEQFWYPVRTTGVTGSTMDPGVVATTSNSYTIPPEQAYEISRIEYVIVFRQLDGNYDRGSVFFTGAFVESSCASCDGDLNGDEVVDGIDLAFILGGWSTDDATADLNKDGTVNGIDLALLLGAWGACSED